MTRAISGYAHRSVTIDVPEDVIEFRREAARRAPNRVLVSQPSTAWGDFGLPLAPHGRVRAVRNRSLWMDFPQFDGHLTRDYNPGRFTDGKEKTIQLGVQRRSPSPHSDRGTRTVADITAELG